MLGCADSIVIHDEDITDFIVGDFNDLRLSKIGGLLFKKLCTKMTLCVKHLAGCRKLQVAFHRFLDNKKTSIDDIEQKLSYKTNISCHKKQHVLCIQDTVEINYPAQKVKKSSFGPTGCSDIKGFFAHPSVIVDAENKDVLGLSSIKTWNRTTNKSHPRDRAIEDKESYRWIESAIKTKNNITNPDKITIIGDRESDIYELLDRIPDDKTELIIRSNHNRNLFSGKFIAEHMSDIKESCQYEIDLDAIKNKRKARKATLSLKFAKVTLKRPNGKFLHEAQEKIKLTCLEVTEIGDVPAGEEPYILEIAYHT